MNDHVFASTITAVLIANAVTALFLFALLRINKRDEWDWNSAGAMLTACAIGMTAAYLAT